jgi:hypothetical protein
MSISPWIQPHVRLPETGEITSFLFARKSWQIFQDDRGTRILVATPDLMDMWVRKGFIGGSCVLPMDTQGKILYNYFVSPSRYTLSPISNGDIAQDYATAYSLAMAISSSRELDPKSDFSNGIFSSLHRKLLPVPKVADGSQRFVKDGARDASRLFPELDDPAIKAGLEAEVERFFGSSRRSDEIIFINWLTRGAANTLGPHSNLGQLVKWLSPEQLSRVLQSAGITAESRLRRTSQDGSESGKDQEDKLAPGRGLFRSKERNPPPRKKSKDGDPSKPPRFSLPGRRALEAFFNEHIVEVLNEPERYRKMGIDNPSGIVLHGPPGCGKTYAADQLVKYLDIPSFFVNSGSVASPYIHDSAKKISSIFDKAIQAAPSLLIVDEMEAYMGHRSSSSSQQHQVEEVAEFLRRIPEAIDKKVVIIAMTNLLDYIDIALLRQGRFDHKIKLDLPDREDARAALAHILSNKPKEDDLDIEPVVDFIVRRPLSDCNYVVREASRLVVRRNLEKLDQAILLEAARRLPPPKIKPDIGF